MSPQHPADGNGEWEPGIDRRSLLKAAGTTAAAGVGLVGTASANEATDLVFCGCSQVCACGIGIADVLFAKDEDDGYTLTWYEEEVGEYVDFNFCVSTDDPEVPDGKIIAVQVGSTRWINPNQCAQKGLEAEQEQLQSTHPRPEGEAGGPCGKPPCEHPGRGQGRSGRGPGGPGRRGRDGPGPRGRGRGRGRGR